MSVFEYTFRPSNLPSTPPTYNPVVQNQSVLGIDQVASYIGTRTGQQPLVVQGILSDLTSMLPDLLSEGKLDLGFCQINLALSGSVTDNTISYTSTTLPLTVKLSLVDKKTILNQARTKLTPLKNVYVVQAPIVNGLLGYRYEGLSGVVPLASAYDMSGLNLSLTTEDVLRIYTSDTSDFLLPIGPDPVTDVIKSSNQHIVVSTNPYDVQIRPNRSYAKFAIYDGVNGQEYMLPTIYRFVMGGGTHFGVVEDADAVYQSLTDVSLFQFVLTGEVLTIAWQSTATGTYGTAVTVANNDEITLVDSSVDNNEIVVVTGDTTVEYYTSLCQSNGGTYEVTGYRE